MFLPFWCLFDVATAIFTVVVCDSIMGITKKIIAKQLRLVFGDERVNIFASSIYCKSQCVNNESYAFVLLHIVYVLKKFSTFKKSQLHFE